MKKYLLFAMVALLSISVSAQIASPKFGSMQAKQKNTPAKTEVRKDFKLQQSRVVGEKTRYGRISDASKLSKTIDLSQQNTLAKNFLTKQVTLNKKDLKNAKAFKSIKNAAPRKAAGQVKELYKAKGIDYYNNVETPVSWEMTSGSVTWSDNTTSNVLYNVVPTPEEFKDVEGYENGVFYQYNIEGDVLTIPSQLVLQYTANGNVYYVFLFGTNNNAFSDDGAIKLKVGEDGSLTPITDAEYILGVFSAPEYSYDNYLGYYEYTYDVEYTFDGQQIALPEGVTATAQFDAYGYHYNTKADEKWTLVQGVKHVVGDGRDTKEEDVPVLVNIIPTPSQLKASNPNGLVLTYTQSGNSIIVAPQKIGTLTNSAGTVYYIYLFSRSTNDGSLVLTIGDDGSLNTVDKEYILAGAFTSDAFDPSLGPTWGGQLSYYQDVKYLLPGVIPTPKAEYEPEGVFLFGEFGPSLYGYNNVLAYFPAYSNQSFKNFTNESSADAYSWRMAKLNNEGEEAEVFTGNERNFAITTEADTYSPAQLTASIEGVEGEPYIWSLAHADEGTNAYITSYLYGPGEKFSDGTSPIFTKASIGGNWLYYAGEFGTPDVNSQGDNINKLILYQGKPAAPLYFTGINYLVWDLKNYDKIDLKCQIVKVTRNQGGYPELGEVIAESIISASDVYQGNQQNGWNLWQLNWNNFYTTDEIGLTTDVDYLMIDEEFAIVIDGWNNGTFSCKPMVEYETNSNGEISTFFCISGDEKFAEDDILAYTGDYSHHYIGFTEAIYGFLHTTDNTNIVAANEGGESTIHVEPLLYSGDDAEPTLIGIEKIVENGVELEDPEDLEWIALGVANEVYTQTEFGFDLKVNVDALPANVSGRTATISLVQPGARLTVTVSQGDVESGITTVKQQQLAGSNKVYDLSGRALKTAKTGLIIRDGKKFIVK